MDPQEQQAIAAMHVPDPAYSGRVCQACGPAYGRWPCDARELLDALVAVEQELAASAQRDSARLTAIVRLESDLRLAADKLAAAKQARDAAHLRADAAETASEYAEERATRLGALEAAARAYQEWFASYDGVEHTLVDGHRLLADIRAAVVGHPAVALDQE